MKRNSDERMLELWVQRVVEKREHLYKGSDGKWHPSTCCFTGEGIYKLKPVTLSSMAKRYALKLCCPLQDGLIIAAYKAGAMAARDNPDLEV